jgi:hypothetical protein
MFSTLMVGTPDPPSAPARGPAVDIFTLMVGTPGPPSAPARGPAINISYH